MTTLSTRQHRLGVRLGALSVGQVVSWGIQYYALIVAAPAIADETGWTLPAITLAFSAGLIVPALSGILVGQWLDRRRRRGTSAVNGERRDASAS